MDHFLLRPDGVGVIDAPETLSRDGLHVIGHARGYALPPAGLELPPLEAQAAHFRPQMPPERSRGALGESVKFRLVLSCFLR